MNPENIPKHMADNLARGCAEFVQRLLADPDSREKIEQWKKTHCK